MIYPPNNDFLNSTQPMIFLGGSIEMGKAKDWQQELGDFLAQTFPNLVVANPRRKDWDSSWEQSITNPLFCEQVNWELNHLERSNYIVFYFDKDTYSPVTLMELGKMLEHTDSKTIFVCCPTGFWRKGNVDIMCQRKNVAVFDTMEELQHALKISICL